jgi:hypothetical protein
MVTIKNDMSVVECVLQECVRRYATPDARMFTVFDRDDRHFLVMEEGWNGNKRIHTAFVHIERQEGQILIQQDYTNHGIANDLVAAGIPKENIILAYKPPALRSEVEYAAA